MPHYKAPDNSLHFIDSLEFVDILPVLSVEITDAEADYLRESLPVVPQVIESLQGLLALDQAGYSSFYESWATAPERTFAQKAFIDKALTWKRDDPTLNAAALDLGLTSTQLDNLFTLAATL